MRCFAYRAGIRPAGRARRRYILTNAPRGWPIAMCRCAQRDVLAATRRDRTIRPITSWRVQRWRSAFMRCRSRGIWLAEKRSGRGQARLTLPVQQAEFGLGCPINRHDGCAKLLSLRRRGVEDEISRRSHADHMKPRPRAAVRDREAKARSDVGKLTTAAVQAAIAAVLSGEKWGLLECGTPKS